MTTIAVDTILEKMRAETPLVQCITNYVAMNIAANVLLAAGASPAMIHAEEEAGEFAGIVSALTINIGTLSPPWIAGMKAAAAGAKAAGTPWVLDPVAHFATSYRARAAQEILDLGPTILRGNASEILAFSGATSGGKGVDAGDTVEAAEETARALARERKMVVAVTGETDFVTDGEREARIGGGSALMPQVTALGCALTCLVGAFAGAWRDDAFEATVTALALYGVAGKRAHQLAQGPGSFQVAFLDTLAAINPAELKAKVEIA
ncbi:hydroxyethylthiazole kinase [Martelella endophytica]|uniref:Hydroxyethylthiazole kinase n=2 Tax=Martelella endophytica TaxID=1486262 RepID=A0A0D5LT92_MAREN|nr:hydroxyethylthiazole kinase [Martelella endophytica]AJY47399.1 hydroxyethylthiazole kinase [Martelella endophytica]